MKTAYIFDFDNMIVDTDLLKIAFSVMAERTIPGVTIGEYQTRYEQWKLQHNGKINMPEFIRDLAFSHGSSASYKELLPQWLSGLDPAGFLFDPDHKLIGDLGHTNVWVLSQADEVHQRFKVAWAKLPWGHSDHDSHVRILEDKSPEAYAQFVDDRFAQGYDHVVVVNDKPGELIGLHRQQTEGITYIEFRYGKYATDESIEEARREIPGLIVVNSFAELRVALMGPGWIESPKVRGERDIS